MGSTGPNWRDVAAKRRHNIDSKIPTEWLVSKQMLDTMPAMVLPRASGILTAQELAITEMRAVDILVAIRDRQFRSVDVATAFCKRAAIAHQATNCIAEVLFAEALTQAQELDDYMQRHGRPKGMLHGLPISVKEHIYVQGTTATSGLIAWADQMSPADALIVQTFREQGAIFHVKTTNPQTLMAIETESNLFGRTLNPHNPSLTCGGSTGGEGALIAMHGSVLGIGTDIGGSIRVPSAFCGIYGLKPSVGRLPHSGLCGLHDGMQNVVGAIGPLATCLEDIELFCAAALANRPWDLEPSMIEIPWKKTVDTPKKLKLGAIWNDGLVRPHPPITRALEEVVADLRNLGHEVVEWDTGLHEALINVINEAYFLDGGREYHEALDAGGEPSVPILRWILDVKAHRQYSVEETWKLNSQLDLLRTMYAKQWNAAGVDAIICPVSPTVASVHGESRYWGYSCIWNALDFPAAVIPCGKVLKSDTASLVSPLPTVLSTTDGWYQELYGYQGPDRYSNAPIGIQIVTRKLQEEKLLTMAATIESSLSHTASSVAQEITANGPRTNVEAHSHATTQKGSYSYTVMTLPEAAAAAA